MEGQNLVQVAAQVPQERQARESSETPGSSAGTRVPSKYTTFNQLYTDDSRDPCSRRYERIMSRFSADIPNAVTANALFNQVINLGSAQLQAYLCCSEGIGGRGPRIYCVHTPTRYVASLDGTSSAWDDLCFAFLGDLVQGQITNVLFHENAFEAISAPAYTQEYILAHLEEFTNETPLLPPVLPDEPNTEAINTRRLMYLPAAYVPLFLNPGGYTLRQAWDRLYPALSQRQELIICRSLLHWLQAASTGTALVNPQEIGDPLVALPVVAPPADKNLLTQRTQILHTLLPGLLAPPQTLELALSQMATAIITQTNENKLVRAQKEAEDLEPKLPSKRFTVTLPVLLEYLQIADEANLPDIWHKWANCTKRQEFQVLRDALEAYARSTQALSASVPVVSAKLVQDLLNFNFVGDSADDIKLGFHPFIITDGNAEHRQINREVARLYGYLQTGDTSVSLTDLENLQVKEIRSVPLSYWELEKTLGSFGNLMGVVLGPQHPLHVAYTAMWKMLQSGLRDDLHAALEYRSYVKPAHVLRSIQLQFYTWFNHRRNRLTPPQPDFTTMLNQIIMQIYVLPHLPPPLYALAYPKKTHPASDGSIPGLIPGGSASGSSSSGSSAGFSSDASTISGITTPTTKPPPSGRGSYITNLQPNATITAQDKPNIKLKDIISNAPPPKMDDGTELCLSYHLRGGCWSNCRRANTHAQTLSNPERQRLTQYLTRRFAALATPATPPPQQPHSSG